MQSFNNQQDLTKALPKKFTILHPIDASQLETTYLPEVVAKLGKRSFLALLNVQLVNPRFDVKFGFKHVKRTLMAGEYTDIALFTHKLVLQKPKQVLSTTAAIEKIFDVEGIVETDETIVYEVYLGEGPYAHTIAETVYNINHKLGPVVERNMQQLGIHEYKMTFIISLGY